MNRSVLKALHYTAVLVALGVVCAAGVAGLYALFKPRIDEQARLAEEQAFARVLPTDVKTFRPDGGVDQVLAKDLTPVRKEAIDSQTGRPFTPKREKEKLRAVYVVRDSKDPQRILGYAAKGKGRGYGGEIDVVVGVRADAALTIFNVEVTKQTETPGLGANCQVKRTDRHMFESTEGQLVTVWTDQYGHDKRKGGKNLKGIDPQTGKPSAELAVTKTAAARRVDAISGATITSKAVTEAVRDAVAKIAAVTRWDAARKCRVPKTSTGQPAATGPATRPAAEP
jgi:RnfABCDGE-type electron transport complex G subunit